MTQLKFASYDKYCEYFYHKCIFTLTRDENDTDSLLKQKQSYGENEQASGLITRKSKS